MYISGRADHPPAETAVAEEDASPQDVRLITLAGPVARPSWHSQLQSIVESAVGQGIIQNVLVHGSYGDATQTNYSDLDLTLLIADEVRHDKQRSRQLRDWVSGPFSRFVLSVDPLQHHGPFLLWNSLQDTYCERILPARVYEKAWSVFPVTLTLNCSPAKQEPPKPLSILTCENLLRKEFSNLAISNLYHAKQYLSNLMLIPAFYLSDTGSPTLKADSFRIFYLEFPDESEVLQAAASIRKSWPSTPHWFRSIVGLTHRVRNHVVAHPRLRRFYRNRDIARRIADQIIPAIPDLQSVLKKKLETP